MIWHTAAARCLTVCLSVCLTVCLSVPQTPTRCLQGTTTTSGASSRDIRGLSSLSLILYKYHHAVYISRAEASRSHILVMMDVVMWQRGDPTGRLQPPVYAPLTQRFKKKHVSISVLILFYFLVCYKYFIVFLSFLGGILCVRSIAFCCEKIL